jgi:hypothetical protein
MDRKVSTVRLRPWGGEHVRHHSNVLQNASPFGFTSEVNTQLGRDLKTVAQMPWRFISLITIFHHHGTSGV